MILKEGGNIFKDPESGNPLTTRISRDAIDPTLDYVEKITGLDHKDMKLGSTGIKSSSGDIDVAVNAAEVNKEELFQKLVAWAKKNHPDDNPRLWVAKSGNNVHFRAPIGGNEANGFVQTDLMMGDPTFMKFDMIHKSDFEMGRSFTKLSNRLHKLRSFISNNICNELKYLDQFQITDGRHFDMWGQMASDGNWEGFMLRKDVGYEGKRSKNLLKVKTFHDAEYTVIDADFGPMAVVRNGKEKQETMLSQVWIEHKGYKVKVGSGFNQEQRIKYMNESIIGKTITVQYFEETTNDKGGISLRFPTVKHIYENKRDC